MRKRPLDDESMAEEPVAVWGEGAHVSINCNQQSQHYSHQPAALQQMMAAPAAPPPTGIAGWGPPALDAAAMMHDERAEAFATHPNTTTAQLSQLLPSDQSNTDQTHRPPAGTGRVMLPRSLQVQGRSGKPLARAPQEQELFW